MLPSRTPVGSGTLYPSLPGRLRADVRRYLEAASATPRATAAVLAPHDRFAYSGNTMGSAFASAEVPATCVVLAPAHEAGAVAHRRASILIETAYRTPLGDLVPDDALGRAIAGAASDLVEEDVAAHARERGVEVLLPFLQMRRPDVRIVPIIVPWTDWERTEGLAHAIADAIGARTDVLVVASSDMHHDESESVTTDKVTIALDRIVALDAPGLLEVAREHHISICGRIPVACAIEVARRRGRHVGEVVGYSHSGLSSGDAEHVVGYAAALIGIA
ncbi:MAG: AmmeMemoRadiSam system protein B [Gemmatimonadaceae bacterium]